jgi:glucokinase
MAAELGHVTLQVDGPECSCGQSGHVEAYLGTRGIAILAGSRLDAASEEERGPLLRAAREAGELSTKAVAEAAAKGDPLSVSILGDVGRLLGLVCASYVNVFNPDVIVIGGGVALCGDLLLGPARKSMKERAMVASQKGVRLVTAELGLSAAAVGAALLVRHALDESGETES